MTGRTHGVSLRSRGRDSPAQPPALARRISWRAGGRNPPGHTQGARQAGRFLDRERGRLCSHRGDLFDGEWRDCNTRLYFSSEMKRLRDVGVMAYIALGNHDAANRMTAGLPWPDRSEEHTSELQ